jgi:hypothetical protein
MPNNLTRSAVLFVAEFDETESSILFNVDEYIENKPLIKRLYGDYMAARNAAIGFDRKAVRIEKESKKQLTTLTEINEGQSKRIAVLEERLRSLRDISIYLAALSILSSLGIGFGVNWITSSPEGEPMDTKGVIILGLAIGINIVELVILFKSRPPK